jgi:hypothetical protein
MKYVVEMDSGAVLYIPRGLHKNSDSVVIV